MQVFFKAAGVTLLVAGLAGNIGSHGASVTGLDVDKFMNWASLGAGLEATRLACRHWLAKVTTVGHCVYTGAHAQLLKDTIAARKWSEMKVQTIGMYLESRPLFFEQPYVSTIQDIEAIIQGEADASHWVLLALRFIAVLSFLLLLGALQMCCRRCTRQSMLQPSMQPSTDELAPRNENPDSCDLPPAPLFPPALLSSPVRARRDQTPPPRCRMASGHVHSTDISAAVSADFHVHLDESSVRSSRPAVASPQRSPLASVNMRSEVVFVEPAKTSAANPADDLLAVLNTGSLAEIQQIKGVGPKSAQKLLRHRSRRPLNDLADLQTQIGLHGATVAIILKENGIEL